MSNIDVKIIADSISLSGVRLTTFQLKYPRLIHSELMTHRVFSRNASSSRAIPVKKVLSQVWNNPAMPEKWGTNKAGMQAGEELYGFKKKAAISLWKLAGKVACGFAWTMMKLNLHKQVANRILEPWQFIHVVVTATEWDNFFELRDHFAAEPTFQPLAKKIRQAYETNKPVTLQKGGWHLPYVTEEEMGKYNLFELINISVARCARVSHVKHDLTSSSLLEDMGLHDRLVGDNPRHSSPAEHQAKDAGDQEFHKNFRGWVQYRELLENNKEIV